jgi:hypothetical protein
MPLSMAARVAIDDGLIAGQSIRGISGREVSAKAWWIATAVAISPPVSLS